ncbi:MAG: tRNA (guanosine(46)-N7)-methyltransferase TrmB [Gammaproteobacteria bacterium]|nr:tRNA (guanosine(46)-N7)-methyltransferase TrmB [Gammaproteobacteria bacterium]
MTAGQQLAFEENSPRFGLQQEAGLLDPRQTFGRDAPLILEIGFGMGQSLVEMARVAPELNFLGIEVYRPGVGKLMHSLVELQLDNVRVYCADAVPVLRECIADQSLHRVQIFFPDPWHKKRHHKRRLIQPEFVRLLQQKLEPGGHLHLATDWENYAEHMLEVLSVAPGLANTAATGQYVQRPDSRPITKFEKRGQRLGHGVWDLLFRCGE